MARPKWTADDDQQKLIDAAIDVFAQLDRAEAITKEIAERAWAAAAAARDGGVHPKQLAKYVTPSAATIYRHIGPDEHQGEAAPE
jgi:hypothetical protein